MEQENNNNATVYNEIKLNDETESSPIMDIISTLQAKLSSSNVDNKPNKENNIVKQTLSNDTINSTTEVEFNNNDTNNSSGLDMNNIMQILSSLNIGGISSEKINQIENATSSSPFFNLDANTIGKITSVLSKMNKDDPRKSLLLSLKPFLRETRQQKLDTYIGLLGLLPVLDIFNKNEGDNIE